jgi:hypothetical protein
MMKTLGFNRPLLGALTALLLLGAGLPAAYADMPPIKKQGDIQYVTGGVGQSESDSMKAAEKDYSLSMVFVQRMGSENVYTADIPVTITDSKGATVLQATTSGPYMLVQLPPGTYKIKSTNNGKELERDATIGRGSHSRAVFEWR